MRHLLLGLPAVMISTLLAACGSSSHEPTAIDSDTPTGPIATAAIADGSQQTEALGVWWLHRDFDQPDRSSLTQARTGESQGGLYDLSIRPFMTPQSLELVSTQVNPDHTTRYQIRFTHPVPMPADLIRPATKDKRADLFLFDVNAVLVLPGDDTFFSGTVRTNTNALLNADGYRMLGPLVDLATLGITNGTNTFPFQLFTNADHAGNPAGNYDAVSGWIDSEVQAPTGYDVIPQGGSATISALVNDQISGSIAVVLVAKYQDPRNGATTAEKRQNRLPDPTNPSLLRYFLPEACGDLQQITAATFGSLTDKDSGAFVNVTAQILDWDHTATVAPVFPDHYFPNHISRSSVPTTMTASVPGLWADGDFPVYFAGTTGAINEYYNVSFAVNNVDQSLTVTDPQGKQVHGLVRIRDAQDAGDTATTILDELQRHRAGDPGFELSTRFQRFDVPVFSGTLAPDVQLVSPRSGAPGEQLTLSAQVIGGSATEYHWDFGGGANPPASDAIAPTITLLGLGAYHATLQVTGPAGMDNFEFTLNVGFHAPQLPATPYNYQFALPAHYTQNNYPFSTPIAKSDNTPVDNHITNAGATLGRVLFYDTLLSRNKTIRCASCHQQDHNFADSTPFSTGFNGGHTVRNTPALANARYYGNGRFFLDERAASLEAAVLQPIQNTVEMGMTLPELRERLASTSYYPALFNEAFGDPTISDDRIGRALAQFIRSLVTFNSKTDLAQEAAPDFDAVFTNTEMTGFNIFNNNFNGWGNNTSMSCNECHRTAGQILGTVTDDVDDPDAGPFATNNGLDAVTGLDAGAGNGRFKAPSLRNIAQSAPYMHDGRFTTLEQVVDFYAQGVNPHPNLNNFLKVNNSPTGEPQRVPLTQTQKDALLAYLQTFTDDTFLTEIKFSDPFTE
ncbi:MAG: cytochrome c peroxidase [bacterium]